MKPAGECDQLLAGLAPEMPKPEHSRPISATQTEIRFTAQQELLDKFKELRGLPSHRNPNPSYAELFEMLADLALKRLDPGQEQGCKKQEGKEEERERPVSTAPPAELVPSSDQALEPSRYIPQPLRRAIWKRDQGQCTCVNQNTGVRCDSKHLAELQHILDCSPGGGHTQATLSASRKWVLRIRPTVFNQPKTSSTRFLFLLLIS